MKTSHLLAIVVLGFAAFWYFGSVQPVHVGQATLPTTQVMVCPTCAGFGFAASTPQKCAQCRGTGQGEWRLKSKTSRKLSNAKPKCTACGGSGSVSVRTTCPQCAGIGKIEGSTTRTIQTARAEPSPWEKFLRLFGMDPEANPPPQLNRHGEYPLVAAYLDVWVRDPSYRVYDWGTFQDVNGNWQATVILESTLGDGSLRKWKVLVRVRDRAVVGCKTAS